MRHAGSRPTRLELLLRNNPSGTERVQQTELTRRNAKCNYSSVKSPSERPTKQNAKYSSVELRKSTGRVPTALAMETSGIEPLAIIRQLLMATGNIDHAYEQAIINLASIATQQQTKNGAIIKHFVLEV